MLPFYGSGYVAEKQFVTCLRKYSESARREFELRKACIEVIKNILKNKIFFKILQLSN